MDSESTGDRGSWHKPATISVCKQVVSWDHGASSQPSLTDERSAEGKTATDWSGLGRYRLRSVKRSHPRGQMTPPKKACRGKKTLVAL